MYLKDKIYVCIQRIRNSNTSHDIKKHGLREGDMGVVVNVYDG